MSMIFIWMLLIVCYLVGKLAYEYGKKEEWRKISRDYVCLHKSVLISRVKVKDKIIKDEKRYRRRKRKETLDRKIKKRYNK